MGLSKSCGQWWKANEGVAHTREHLDRCVAAFMKVGKEFGVV